LGDYAEAADLYDLLYTGAKDYAAEAQLLERFVREAQPAARTLLDVGCGTGAHARALTDLGFAVDGVDIEPRFVELARSKCPEGTFVVGDMTALDLPGRYDVVTCLFSAIGYVRSEPRLRDAVAAMARHLTPTGLLLVDPWFEPGQLTDGWISVLTGEGEGTGVCRMSRTVLDGAVSRLEFEYLVGSSSGIERRSEVHELGLFTPEQMEAAFAAAGLRVTRKQKALRTRGLYVGARATASAFRSRAAARLRDYRAADRAACLDVFDSNVPTFFRVEERPGFENFLDALPGPYFVLVDAAGAVLGCGGYAVRVGTGVADLCWGMVRRDRHREGHGRSLGALRIARIVEQPGVAEIALNTSQHTVGFYELLGFHVTAVESDGYAPGLDRVEMLMRLQR